MTTPTSLRDETLAAIPGYAAAAASITHLAKYKTAHRKETFPTVKANAIDQVRDLIAKGEPIPDSIGETLEAAERADRATQLRSIAVRDAIGTIDTDLDALIIDGAADAFQFLNTTLDDLIGMVRHHAASLHGVTNATAALTADPDIAAAWASIAQLTDRYDDIRDVQLELFQKGTDTRIGTYDRFNTAGLYRDFVDTTSFFHNRRTAAAGPNGPTHDAAAAVGRSTGDRDYLAWMRDVPAAFMRTGVEGFGWWPDGDRTAALVAIATCTKPWVPDIVTLNRSFDAAITATRPATHANPPQLEARAELYERTGLTSRHDITASYSPPTNMIDDGSGNIMRDRKQAAFDKRIKHAALHHQSVQADRERSRQMEAARVG